MALELRLMSASDRRLYDGSVVMVVDVGDSCDTDVVVLTGFETVVDSLTAPWLFLALGAVEGCGAGMRMPSLFKVVEQLRLALRPTRTC